MQVIIFISLRFQEWLSTMFIIPFQSMDMLWLLVPVWISWWFAEYFQEKHGTSLGNATSNAVVVLWGAIDCARQTVNLLAKKSILGTLNISLRFTLASLIFLYGGTIVYLGIKGNPLIKYIARIRVVTYVFIQFVPVFYNAIPLSFNHILASILFYPIFHYAIELLDYLMPDPVSIQEESSGPKQTSPAFDFSSLK